MARVVVASYLVRFPVGGYLSWMLQWLVGFDRLGHEVYFVEKAGWDSSCIDLLTWERSNDGSKGMAIVRELFGRHGLENRWCFVDAAGEYHGLSRAQIEEVFRTTDVFIDHMRGGEWDEEAGACGTRVLIDAEPALTQIRLTERARAGAPPPPYDHFYSVGLNIGSPTCLAPQTPQRWRPIVDPVVTELFPTTAPPPGAPFTTIMSWQAYAPIHFDGAVYGQKDVEFPKFQDLPQRTRVPLELAVAGKHTPQADMRARGWRVRDAIDVTRTYDAWMAYLAGSAGEFAVAKNIFVATNSGAFSDRSAAYLAAGRPVVMQDTGFSAYLPCGEGLFAVRTIDEAADALASIEAEPERHARAARELAEEHFEAERVLGGLLSDVGL